MFCLDFFRIRIEAIPIVSRLHGLICLFCESASCQVFSFELLSLCLTNLFIDFVLDLLELLLGLLIGIRKDEQALTLML